MTRVLLLLFSILTFGCNKQANMDIAQIAQRITNIDNQLINKQFQANERFKVYKTKNYHTLLKLDTATGAINIIQISLDNNEGEFSHSKNMIEYSSNNIGRYELYNTRKEFQFVLLDKMNGNAYRVQWGTKPELNYRTNPL